MRHTPQAWIPWLFASASAVWRKVRTVALATALAACVVALAILTMWCGFRLVGLL